MLPPLHKLLLLSCLAWPLFARADSASLLAQAQVADPPRYAFALAKGAEIRHTSDNKSFTMWWQPSSTAAPKGVIVPLHGHAGWATDGIALWQPYAEKYGYAILSLQWWFGGGEATSDYYTPDEIYPILSSRLGEKAVKPGTVFFNGFSRGSANSYAVAALDAAASGRRYFGLVLSNAGGAQLGYPPNQQIDAGYFGQLPFKGVNWAMYCGELDPEPAMNGCVGMMASKNWVMKHGATMVLFIDDPTGGHGGFMLNSANVELALSTYATVLAVPTNAEADCLFNWGEDRYPVDFVPRRPASLVSAPYYYRYYATTQVYLGVSSADNHLYHLDARGVMTDLGLAATWSAQAGCR